MKKLVLYILFLILGFNYQSSNAMSTDHDQFLRIYRISLAGADRSVVGTDRSVRVNIDASRDFYLQYVERDNYKHFLELLYKKYELDLSVNLDNLDMSLVKPMIINRLFRGELKNSYNTLVLKSLIEISLILKNTANLKIDLARGLSELHSKLDRFFLKFEFLPGSFFYYIANLCEYLVRTLEDQIYSSTHDILFKNYNFLSEFLIDLLSFNLADYNALDAFMVDVNAYIDSLKDVWPSVDNEIFIGSVSKNDERWREVLTEKIKNKDFIPYEVEFERAAKFRQVYFPKNRDAGTEDYMLKQYVDLDETIICASCYDENINTLDDILTCPMGHAVCKTCLAHTAKMVATQESLEDFVCHIDDCDCRYSTNLLPDLVENGLISTAVAEIINRLETIEAAELAGIELFSCPACQKKGILENDDSNVYYCEFCHEYSCKRCFKRSHYPYSCEEARIRNVEDIKVVFNRELNDALITYCPDCKKPLLKVEACNCLRCPCGVYVCNVCKVKINPDDYRTEDPHSHFAASQGLCPLFTDDTRLLELAINKAREKVREWVNNRFRERLPIKLDGRTIDIDRIDLDRLIDEFAQEARDR